MMNNQWHRGLSKEDLEFLGWPPEVDEAAEEAKFLAELNAIGCSDDSTIAHQEVSSAPTPLAKMPYAASIAAVIDQADAADASVTMAPAVMTAPKQATSIPDGYASFIDGIYELPADETADPIFICSPLSVDAQFADHEGRGCGRLVCVKSARGEWHEIPVSNAELQKSPKNVIATLVDHGVELGAEKATSDRLLKLLKVWKPEQHLQSVNRMGWVDAGHSAFVLRSTLIGRSDLLPLSPPTGIGTGLTSSGDVEGWKQEVGMKCCENPLMILAVSLAFSGPLLAPLGLAGGGLHFRGASSSGKTTLLNLAASVWGGRQLITQWRATSNGLEAIAATLNDMLLPLDEIAEIPARDLHNAIYMLANGTGKARMTKDVTLANQSRWRLAMISSGEISVQEKLKEAGRDAMAGHEVRLIDIEADSRAYGVFDNLHGTASGAVFAETIQQVVRSHHGAVGAEFVRLLIDKRVVVKSDDLERAVRAYASKMTEKLPSAPDGQISRVATRFAVIAVAGALATQFGLTGWQDGASFNAAKQAFLDWYDRRYGAKRDAVDSFVKPLQDFLSANMNTLPRIEGPHADGADPAGWCDATRAYLPQSTWTGLFPGGSATSAAKALLDMQMLLPGEDGRFTRRFSRAVPGRPRLYGINVDRVMVYKAG